MANIDLIKKLREETGAGFADIKEALANTNNNYEDAKKLLVKKGFDRAAKRSDREAKQGVIASYLHFNNKIGVLVELNCETDFVAKNDEFLELGRNIAMQICATDPKYIDESDVPQDVKDNIEKELMQIPKLASNPEILKKELERRFNEFVQENCLLKQKFFKDSSKTIEDLIKSLSGKVGEAIRIGNFVRFEVGK